jgi:hypothetical protein
MNIGVFTMFLTAWIFWILCLAAFTFSGLLSQVVCEAVRDLENNYTVTTTTTRPLNVAAVHQLSHAANPSSPRAYKLPNYADIVHRCKAKQGAYSTFDLHTAFNIDDILDFPNRFPMQKNKLFEENTKLFLDGMTNVEFELSRVSTNLKNFQNSIGSNILNMEGLRQLIEHPEANQIRGDLSFELKKLAELGNHSADLLQSQVKLLENSIQSALILVPAVTESYLADNKRIQNILEDADPLGQMQAYTDFAHDQISFRIGDCRPLYNALDTTIDLFCYKIAQPVASFWFSLQILLLLFIPLIITGILLDRLYRLR